MLSTATVRGLTPVIDFIHLRLGIALIAVYLICSLWAAWQYLRYKAISGGFRATFLMAGGLLVVQALVGLGLLLEGQRPGEFLHFIYGGVALVAAFGGFTYSGSLSRSREALLLAGCSWLLLGLTIRALMTGP